MDLPNTFGQFEDSPVSSRPLGQRGRNPLETSTKQQSAQEVSTKTQTEIVPEDDNLEHTSETGNNGDGEDNDFTSSWQPGATTGGGGDGGDNSSFTSSDDSGSDLSIPSQKGTIDKVKKVKKKKSTIGGETPEQQR